MFSKTLSLTLSTLKDLTTYLYLRIIISNFTSELKAQTTSKTQQLILINTEINTVKPVLSGHRIKRTPSMTSIKRTIAEVPKFISLIYFKNETFIKRTRTPRKYLKW